MNLEPHYKVNLPLFEGPLDLLLYLVRKNDLDIYDIPISFITEEYLNYLDVMREWDIDRASDFLAYASELLLLKSRMLLPTAATEEEEEAVDPQAELARRLILYQQFKAAAHQLQERWVLDRDVFKRGKVAATPETTEVPIQGEVIQLVNVFSQVLQRLPKQLYHEVAVDRLGISDRIYQLVEICGERRVLPLEEMLPHPLTRYDVVITFLALLEMTRLKMIRVYQDTIFGSLVVRWIMEQMTPEESQRIVKEVF